MSLIRIKLPHSSWHFWLDVALTQSEEFCFLFSMFTVLRKHDYMHGKNKKNEETTNPVDSPAVSFCRQITTCLLVLLPPLAPCESICRHPFHPPVFVCLYFYSCVLMYTELRLLSCKHVHCQRSNTLLLHYSPLGEWKVNSHLKHSSRNSVN